MGRKDSCLNLVTVTAIYCNEQSETCPNLVLILVSCWQYQDEIDALNQVARHRPRSSLVLGIQQENRQIRDLQQENKGGREEHMECNEDQS